MANHGYFTKITTGKIGTIWVACTKRGLCRIEFNVKEGAFLKTLPDNYSWTRSRSQFEKFSAELKKYLKGKPVRFRFSVDLISGTAFQKEVWKNIARIPWGKTRNYAWLAQSVGRPKAMRAVANACGNNPVPIVIPCHRVIASNGTLGGFSSGIGIKRKLLKIECSPLAKPRGITGSSSP